MMNYGSSSREYTVNLYRGCTHNCSYCYAPSLIHDERQWGSYVDAKVNAPAVLERELRKAKKLVVFISSASDPYQPVEAKYGITRQVLKVLLKHKFPVLILTRSPLVLRDVDIFKQFPWLRVGFSISSVPTKFFEPGVPPLEKRLEALAKLRDAGITTWVSMAPVIPGLIRTDLEALFDRLKTIGVSTVTVGLLRFIGYEESRIMFESRSNLSARQVMQNGSEVYQQIMTVASIRNIDTSGSCLRWSEDGKVLEEINGGENHRVPITLDSFGLG
jgi:DNA repair photolyase